MRLTKNGWIDHFKKNWQPSVELRVENLLVEISARKHIKLFNPHSSFMVIGRYENSCLAILLVFRELVVALSSTTNWDYEK